MDQVPETIGLLDHKNPRQQRRSSSSLHLNVESQKFDLSFVACAKNDVRCS
jgi:hypothetical protein